MYKVTLVKTSKIIEKLEIQIEELDLDWYYTDYKECLNMYEQLVVDETKHLCQITYTHIQVRIRVYEDNKILKQVNLSNW